MLVYIVDSYGNHGWIRDDLALRYNGPGDTADAIERCISEIEANAESTDEVVESLIIELPHQCAVQEVGREQARLRGVLTVDRDSPCIQYIY